MNKKTTVAITVAAFLIGGGFGSVANASAPAKTIVKTVSVKVPGPTTTVVKTVNVDVPGPATNTVPQACLRALDLADEGFGYATEGLSLASDAFTAIGNGDIAGVSAANDKMGPVANGISGISGEYNSTKAECRSTS